jgi:type I restriction enzyme S subunit
MESEWQDLRFSQAVSINPPVRLRVGAIFPFVDMQAVDPSARYVYASEQRVFNGGGSRFVPGDTLMARITPCLENGKIARFNSPDGLPGHGSTEFIVIRGREGVTDSDFAYYLTRSQLVSC